MMRVAPERLRDDLLELRLNFIDGLAGREAGPIGYAEDMRVDCESLLAERGVEDHVRGLAADARKRLQLLTSPRNLGIVIVNQRLAKRDDVLCLGIEQADRLDRVAKRFFA